jgi:hypothetical protein
VSNPRSPIVAPYHRFGRMPSPPRDRPKPTTPEEEGIEFYPDSWERFERTVDKVIKSPPAHRTGKKAGGDCPQRQRSGRAAKKSG